jgi:hypothetical protein
MVVIVIILPRSAGVNDAVIWLVVRVSAKEMMMKLDINCVALSKSACYYCAYVGNSIV